ncbi:alpha/beta-hydrolase [Sparassis latifolia]
MAAPVSKFPEQEKLSPEEIAASDHISGLKLSQDAVHVVYCVGPKYKAGDNRTSALWLAKTSKENGARKLTSGAMNDYSPAFHPVSSDIYFLSDHQKAGDPAQIYTLPISATEDDEPSAVTSLDGYNGVNSFVISPDGNYLAFIQQNKPSYKDTKEPISVWREKKDLGSLCLIDLRHSTKSIRTLVSVDAHVESFAWSPDSSSIIYRLLSHPDLESHAFPVTEAIVSIDSGDVHGTFEYPRLPARPTIWRHDGELVFIQVRSPSYHCSSNALWKRASDGTSAATYVAYGDDDDVETVADLGVDSQYAVAVASGLDTKFDVYNEDHNAFTAFETDKDMAVSYLAWDMRSTADGHFVLVALVSSSVHGKPEDVWCGVTEKGKKGTLSKKLSLHNSWFTSAKAPVTTPFEWNSTDGQNIQGVFSYPRGAELKKLPTVVVAHGGPYARDTLALPLYMGSWRIFLASHGYLVLSPNYRGSSGRGDNFAKAANGGMGTLEWTDIETMVEHCIGQGMVDPDKLAIAGYSQGGFLTAWGCTRPNNTFKAGVVGAGVSDWGLLAATSDMPDFEAHLGGAGPWTPGEPVYLRGSPLKDAKNVRAPLLFLHGKDDKVVPVTQAIAMLRGVERAGHASVKPQLVIYPREDHGFEERIHVEDVLRRLVEHLNLYVK